MISLEKPRADLPWLAGLGLAKTKPFYHTKQGAAFLGDSLSGMKKIPSESVDLVFTSPPFALTRKKEYGNEPAERYLEWFIPFCEEIKRILTPTGSFVLDIVGVWMQRTETVVDNGVGRRNAGHDPVPCMSGFVE